MKVLEVDGMFGFVNASLKELDEAQRRRYGAVYCGICRQIRLRHSQVARLGLQYDMAFLALLLMSLYEPEEISGDRACLLHPIKKRPWVDNEYVRYGADMNVALAHYKCLDDWDDDRKLSAKLFAGQLGRHMSRLRQHYPRQCQAIEASIRELRTLEQEGCTDPDRCANTFGRLMGELLVYRQDFWEETLRQLGFYLGRAIYLADAMADYPRDMKKKSYNPLSGTDPDRWEEYLTLAMGACTARFERLPLVQDKQILDNILYSGVWVSYSNRRKAMEEKYDTRPL